MTMNTTGDDPPVPSGNTQDGPLLEQSASGKPQPAAVSFLALWALAIFGRARQAPGQDAPRPLRGPPP